MRPKSVAIAHLVPSRTIPALGALFTLILVSSLALPARAAREGDRGMDKSRTYRVTIENLTPNRGNGASQVLSPALVVAHTRRLQLFSPGQPASPAVADVAQDAIAATGISMFSGNPEVVFVGAAGGAVLPGGRTTFEFSTHGKARFLSLVTMLVNTNDGFTGLEGVRLKGRVQEFYVKAYDAGSEVNDQLKASIPGPCCGDTGRHGTAEHGVIEEHRGILPGVGELDPAVWGWPTGSAVAHITVERLQGDDRDDEESDD